MSESINSNSNSQPFPAEDEHTSTSSYESLEPSSDQVRKDTSMVMTVECANRSATGSDSVGANVVAMEDKSVAEQQSSDAQSESADAGKSDAAEQGPEGSAPDNAESADAGESGGGGGGSDEENERDSTDDETKSTDETGSEEASATEADDGSTSDLNSEMTSTPKPTIKYPGKMVSGALEYDLQDMYPEITLLFEDKQSAWNCQDPATIRAIWLESRTNLLRDWKYRNGRIHAKEKPKLEVKPNMAMTLRKQLMNEKAKAIDWKEMYIPPGNDAPKYEALTLPTNKVTEVRYNFVRNNPPVPSSYVLHYEKFRRPPFNVFQPHRCLHSLPDHPI